MGTLAGLVPEFNQNHDTLMKDTNHTNSNYHTSRPVVEAPDVFRESSAEVARRHIDLDILRLEESIRALKSKRNNLAAIAKLPAELLSKIFEFCAADNTQPSGISWITVTHVSHHWRAVALNCPSLWTRIVFSQARWAEEMLKRSKMASLIIKASLAVSTPKMLDAVKAALRHMSRARELSVTAAIPTMEKVFKAPPASAPLLYSLILATPRPNYGADYAFVIPEGFLCEETPNLRHLELTQCDFQWNSQFLRGLTHLKIHGVPITARPTIHQLLEVLERMPDLESLDLLECLPVSEDTLDHVVKLPSLKSISITSTVLECTGLIKHISFPLTAAIKLCCHVTETENPSFSSVLTILEGFNTSDGENSCPSIRTLSIDCTRPSRILFTAWPNTIPCVETWTRHSFADASIQLNFSWRLPLSTRRQHVMAEVCKALPLSQLRTLQVIGNEDIDIGSDTWAATFGGLTRLKIINISGNSAHTLVKSLLFDRTHGGVEMAGPTGDLDIAASPPTLFRKNSVPLPVVCFPGLQRLHIGLVDFDIFDMGKFTEINDLTDCMMERYERGAEVRELSLVECKHLGYERVDQLREIVVDVDWDEAEEGFTESDEEEPFDIGYFDGYAHSDFYDSDQDMVFGF